MNEKILRDYIIVIIDFLGFLCFPIILRNEMQKYYSTYTT